MPLTLSLSAILFMSPTAFLNIVDSSNSSLFDATLLGVSLRDKFDESTILRKAVRDIKRIADKERVSGIVVHSNPMLINAIGKR